MKQSMKNLLIILASVMFPAVASAEALDTGNTAWMLTSTALVLFMTIPGLSFFYAGLVSAKNVLSILMQCFSITCLASIIWLVYGYSLAFTDGGSVNAWIGSLDKAWLIGVDRNTLTGDLPETVFVMFQLTFAIITPALIVGGFAERMKYSSMLLFSLLWITVVYIPVCHWVWGGGWLSEAGLLDFAGGTVVHITAGVAALVAALVLKARTGFPDKPMPPHNLTLTVMGAGMLWVGWFGFNAGSAVAANGDAGMAMLVTHMSAAAASLTWAAMEWMRYGKPSVLGMVTGTIAGLGAITPASGFVGPLGALVIGVSAGLVCFFATNLIKRTCKIDDSLDVFPVHGVGGVLGIILCGVFVTERWGGLGYAEGMTMSSQLGVQLMGAVATVAWTAIATFVVLKIVQMLLGLRVDEEAEIEGLDIHQYDEKGYNEQTQLR